MQVVPVHFFLQVLANYISHKKKIHKGLTWIVMFGLLCYLVGDMYVASLIH
jgi:hypothetical protein